MNKWLNGADEHGRFNFYCFCLPDSEKHGAFLWFQDVLTTKCRTTPLLYLINTTKSIHAHTHTSRVCKEAWKEAPVSLRQRYKGQNREVRNKISQWTRLDTHLAVWGDLDVLFKTPTSWMEQTFLELIYCQAGFVITYKRWKLPMWHMCTVP